MSRFDMNTCQTSIKTDILLSAAEDPSLILYRQRKNTTVVPTELD